MSNIPPLLGLFDDLDPLHAAIAFMTPPPIKVTIQRSPKDGRWYWHAQAANNRFVADGGQGYESESACRQGFEVFQRSVASATIRVVK